MQPSSNLYSERAYDADQLRIKVMRLALTFGAEYFRQRQEQNAGHAVATAQASTDALDAAVIQLADKLREPEHCTQCGQVVPPVLGDDLRAGQ